MPGMELTGHQSNLPRESHENVLTVERMSMHSLLQELVNLHPQGLTIAAYGNTFYCEQMQSDDTEGRLKIFGAEVVTPQRVVTNHDLRDLSFTENAGSATVDANKKGERTSGRYVALVGNETNSYAAAITVEGNDDYLMGIMDSLTLTQDQSLTILFYYTGTHYPNINELTRTRNEITSRKHRSISEQTPPQIT